jgi:D-arabinose 1-dehydrogenase-like Zn-dependent alcohol dehydrogenase
VKSRAAVFHGAGRPLEVREIDLDEPGPGDVLVRMAAVGLCGTELHSIRGEWERPTPAVLGHEGAGVVEAVGDEVTSVKCSPGRLRAETVPTAGAAAPRRASTSTGRSATARSSTARPG